MLNGNSLSQTRAHETYPDSGFTLFATSMHRRLGVCARESDAAHTARPAWNRLSDQEKHQWRARARELSRVEKRPPASGDRRDPPAWRGRGGSSAGGRRRVKTTQNEHFRAIEAEDDEIDEEFELGETAAENTLYSVLDHRRAALSSKLEHDRVLVSAWLAGRSPPEIRELRWLFCSLQTFGITETECLPAEIAIDEFTMADGVIDMLHSLVAGWQVDSEILLTRAHFHSNETHHIPLHAFDPFMPKRQLMSEILGRSEPRIASSQGIAVGLYSPELTAEEEAAMRAGVQTDSLAAHLERLSHQDFSNVFISDESGRRPLLCLASEYEEIVASMETFKRRMRLDYDGFPSSSARFILAESFALAVADALGHGRPHEQFECMLDELGKPLPPDFSTPWERDSEVFCRVHAPTRNACCAAVTAARAVFVLLYAADRSFTASPATKAAYALP